MKPIIKTIGKKDNDLIKSLANDVVIPDKLQSGFTKEQFKSLVESGVEIDNFIGGVEKEASILEDDVPKEFPKSTIIKEDGTEEQRKWKNYCIFRPSIDKKKIVIFVGERDLNGNRQDVVPNSELICWINYFGLENIMTKHHCMELINSKDYLIEDLGVV